MTILLLHGATGSAKQFDTIAKLLQQHHQVFTLNFAGHGGQSMPDDEFSIGSFADQVLLLLNEQKIERISIFGYSMGGYVAMYLAKFHPDRIDRIITLATKFEWNESISNREIKMLDPVKDQRESSRIRRKT